MDKHNKNEKTIILRPYVDYREPECVHESNPKIDGEMPPFYCTKCGIRYGME